MSSELFLRPHHGLCLGFFEGNGYSGSFTRHMAAVLTSLVPDTPVRLTGEHDVICAHCPNRFTPCPNAVDYDRQVLALCGLEIGQILTWETFRDAVCTHILIPGKLPAVCGSCRWAALCQEKNKL